MKHFLLQKKHLLYYISAYINIFAAKQKTIIILIYLMRMKSMKRRIFLALSLLICIVINAQDLVVQGTVLSAVDNFPVIGATVVEDGNSTNGTMFSSNFHTSPPAPLPGVPGSLPPGAHRLPVVLQPRS